MGNECCKAERERHERDRTEEQGTEFQNLRQNRVFQRPGGVTQGISIISLNAPQEETSTVGQESTQTELAGADFNGSNVENTQLETAVSDVESSQLGGSESDVENTELEQVKEKAYERLEAIKTRLKANLKDGEYDKLKSNFNHLKDKVLGKDIDNFSEDVKKIIGLEQAEQLKDKLSDYYNQQIKIFATIIDTIEAEPQELGTEQQGITPVEERCQVELAMGQGVAANLGQVILNSKDFSTCSPIVLFNETSKIGGLFHFPSGKLDESKPSLKAIYTKIKPTEIHLNERNFPDLYASTDGIKCNSTDVKDLKEFFKECGYTAKEFRSIDLKSGDYAITLEEDGKNVLIKNEIESGGKALSVAQDQTEEKRQKIVQKWEDSPLATKYGRDYSV